MFAEVLISLFIAASVRSKKTEGANRDTFLKTLKKAPSLSSNIYICLSVGLGAARGRSVCCSVDLAPLCIDVAFQSVPSALCTLSLLRSFHQSRKISPSHYLQFADWGREENCSALFLKLHSEFAAGVTFQIGTPWFYLRGTFIRALSVTNLKQKMHSNV